TAKQSFLLPLGSQDPLGAITATAAAQELAWQPSQLAESQTKHVGGPLYPPTHALIFAPLALGDHPHWAYRVTQSVMLLSRLFAGLGVRVVRQRRVLGARSPTALELYPA